MADTAVPAPQRPVQPRPRKRRRVFRWVFLAVQLIFVIWLVTGIIGVHSGGGINAYCAHHAAAGDQHLCRDASNTGSAFGFIAIVAAWCVTDFLLVVPWLVWRLSHRPTRAREPV